MMPQPKPKQPPQPRPLKAAQVAAGTPAEPPAEAALNPQAARGAAVATNLLACMGVGGGLGYALDMWLGSLPWGLLGGLALGFMAWLRELWGLINQPKA